MAKNESDMIFSNDRQTDRDNKITTNYNDDIVKSQNARNTQYHDTDPRIEKEGFLGVDDLDRLRRRKIGKIF